MKYEHLNKVNLIGAFAIGIGFILTVMLSALDLPYSTVQAASVSVSSLLLLWGSCAMFILLSHDPKEQVVPVVVSK